MQFYGSVGRGRLHRKFLKTIFSPFCFFPHHMHILLFCWKLRWCRRSWDLEWHVQLLTKCIPYHPPPCLVKNYGCTFIFIHPVEWEKFKKLCPREICHRKLFPVKKSRLPQSQVIETNIVRDVIFISIKKNCKWYALYLAPVSTMWKVKARQSWLKRLFYMI